jgi:hypothetical protein
MKPINRIITLTLTVCSIFVILTGLGLGLSGVDLSDVNWFAPSRDKPQNLPPKESIPSNITGDLRKQIKRLYSDDPVERAYGVIEIGKLPSQAVPSIPYLMGILDDKTDLVWADKEKINFEML